MGETAEKAYGKIRRENMLSENGWLENAFALILIS